MEAKRVSKIFEIPLKKLQGFGKITYPLRLLTEYMAKKAWLHRLHPNSCIRVLAEDDGAEPEDLFVEIDDRIIRLKF